MKLIKKIETNCYKYPVIMLEGKYKLNFTNMIRLLDN